MYNKYNFLKELPLLRLLLIFIIGLVLSKYLEGVYKIFLVVSLALFVVISIGKQQLHSKKLKQQTLILSIISMCIILTSGIIYLPLNNALHHKQHYSNYIPKDSLVVIKLKIEEEPKEKNKSVQVIGKVLFVYNKKSYLRTKGKLVVYLEKSTEAMRLQYGDIIIAKCKIQEIYDSKNPNEFSYKKYQALHQIYFSTYIQIENWKSSGENKSNYFKRNIIGIQKKFKEILVKYIPNKESLSIALALLIGNKEELASETIDAYSKSGAMHILAVSGLHVGIVYLVFNQVLFFLEKPKLKKWKIVLLILLIWMYAFLTGGSASVLRAATMFTFIAIGKNLQQHVNIYNIIAASAWVLLVYDPYLLWQVGFQLSYLAVIGILLLHNKIYGLYVSNNNIIDKIWNISAVSIAAQIATFPLSLYYFHIFPNYFLLANLFVIPLATFIVYMGIALLAVSKFVFLAKYLGIALSISIQFLNWFIEQVNSLPFSLSEGWNLTILEVILLYTISILLYTAFSLAHKISLQLALLLLLLFTISYNSKTFIHSKDKYLYVYHIPKESAIEFQDGFHTTALYSKGISYKSSLHKQHILNNWYANKITSHHTMKRINTSQIIKFANKTILIVDSNYQNLESLQTFDYVIIKNQQKMYFETFSKKIKAKLYIFDTSNNPYQLNYWKKDCESLQENCYFVQEQTAFIQKLN